MSAAVDFWRERVPLTDDEYFKMPPEATARAFSASGLTRIDWAQKFYKGIDAAIADGTTFEEFRKNLEPTLRSMGWDKLNPYRLETVFRTNVQTAYQSGRYRWMSAASADRPFWRYIATDDNRVRPAHLSMNNRVFRADDPIWDTWYPPNGFSCRCTVQTLTSGQISRQKITVENGSAVDVEPDKGFDHNPGKVSLAESAARNAFALAGGALDIGWRDFGRPASLDIVETAAPWPGASAAEMQARFATDLLLGSDVRSLVDPLIQPAIASLQLSETLSRDNLRRANILPELIGDPAEVWMLPAEVDGRIEMKTSYLKRVRRQGEKTAFAIATVNGTVIEDFQNMPGNKSGEVNNKIRRGFLIYGN